MFKFKIGEAEPPVDAVTTVSENTTQAVYGSSTVPFDIDKLAKAVARHETADCTKGYGATYNNCFGLKNGSIVPCETGTNRMCIFATKEESYEAFKKVWLQGYGDHFPTFEDARAYAGGDRVESWYANVQKFYYK